MAKSVAVTITAVQQAVRCASLTFFVLLLLCHVFSKKFAVRTNIPPRAAFAQASSYCVRPPSPGARSAKRHRLRQPRDLQYGLHLCHDAREEELGSASDVFPGEHVGVGAKDDVRPHSSILGKTSRRHDFACRVGVVPPSLSAMQEFYMDGVGACLGPESTTYDVALPRASSDLTDDEGCHTKRVCAVSLRYIHH